MIATMTYYHHAVDELRIEAKRLKDRVWDLALDHEADLRRLPDGLAQEVRGIAAHYEDLLHSIERVITSLGERAREEPGGAFAPGTRVLLRQTGRDGDEPAIIIADIGSEVLIEFRRGGAEGMRMIVGRDEVYREGAL